MKRWALSPADREANRSRLTAPAAYSSLYQQGPDLLSPFMGDLQPSSDGSIEDYRITLSLITAPTAHPTSGRSELAARSGAIDISWIREVESDGAEISTTQLGKIVDGLNQALNSGRYEIIDGAMKTVKIQSMSIEALIAFLRVTLKGRPRLRQWQAFREAVREELEKRALNSDRFLRGLD